MAAIRIRRTIEFETIHLPELKAWIGREVEIELSEPADASPPKDWSELDRIVRRISNYDFDACREQRELDRRRAAEAM